MSAQPSLQGREPAHHLSHEYILHLLRQAESHRELAANCRNVAPSVAVETSRVALVEYADRLERWAVVLEDQAGLLAQPR
ncbi:MAG TPA: hypothetical protein VFB13_03215 [Reyranella sp.]|jgi:hypothetical protein|nr:hypothetical protein [Reyranella sp.]